MENDNFLRELCNIVFDKNQLKRLHNDVTNHYLRLLGRVGAAAGPLGPATGEFGAAAGPLGPATGEFGAAAGPLGPTTDNTDWNKQDGQRHEGEFVIKYSGGKKNNLDGADAISFNTIKIVNGDGKLINVKRNQQSADDGVESNQPYSCPNCQTNITAEVKQKRERAADYQFYFCKACEHLFQDEHLE